MKNLTPPMGWNSWDCYGAAVNEETVRKNADFMAKHLKKYGWEYIVVDIQWSNPTAPLEKAELFKQISNMWRITDDFWDRWELLYDMFSRTEKWCVHNGAGHWADADMLPIGPILQDYDKANRTKFTQAEQMTMLTLWSIFRSPLMIGGEMTGFDDFTMSLLTNEGILEMHHNARHSHQVWRREIDGNEYILWTAASSRSGGYIAVFNAGDNDGEVKIPLSDLELYGKISGSELWSGKAFSAEGDLYVSLESHGAKAFYYKEA